MYKSIEIKKNEVGFSLIELLVTISILAIMVTMATPNLTRSIAKQKMKYEDTTITSMLKEAKTESIVRRKQVVFSIIEDNSNPARIEVTIQDNDGNDVVIASHILKNNIDLALTPTGTTKVQFLPSGRINLVDGSNPGNNPIKMTVCHSSIDNERPRIIEVNTNTRISHVKEKAEVCS